MLFGVWSGLCGLTGAGDTLSWFSVKVGAKKLKDEIDPDLIEAYRGTVSLPFEPRENKWAAVKIIEL